MQTQKQVCTSIRKYETLVLRFLLKFPRNALHNITVSKNLVGYSFSVAQQITGQADFPCKHAMRILTSYYDEDVTVL